MAAVQCLSSRWEISCRFQSLSPWPSSYSSSRLNATGFRPLSSSANISSSNALSTGFVSFNPIIQTRHGRSSVVCEATPTPTTRKADSAAKRVRLAEKRRIRNKARKSEIRTRMRKVLEDLEKLRKNRNAQPEEVLRIEKLIAEAYSAIDKAVQVGTLHRNTGARRKSRLARKKRAVEIHHGWYTPAPAPAPAPEPAPAATA